MTASPARTPIRIAILQAADAPAYKRLRDAALLRTPDAFSTDYATAVTRPAAIYSARFSRPGHGPFYLGAFTEAGQLAGSLGFEREEARFKRHIGHIQAVMVDAPFESQGIARQLLAACIAHAETIDGLELLQLGVNASNERAIRLYEGAGFRPYGRMPRAIVIDGQGHDHLLMMRPLVGCPVDLT